MHSLQLDIYLTFFYNVGTTLQKKKNVNLEIGKAKYQLNGLIMKYVYEKYQVLITTLEPTVDVLSILLKDIWISWLQCVDIYDILLLFLYTSSLRKTL